MAAPRPEGQKLQSWLYEKTIISYYNKRGEVLDKCLQSVVKGDARMPSPQSVGSVRPDSGEPSLRLTIGVSRFTLPHASKVTRVSNAQAGISFSRSDAKDAPVPFGASVRSSQPIAIPRIDLPS